MGNWEYAALYLVRVESEVRQTRLFGKDKVSVEHKLIAVIVRVNTDPIRIQVTSDLAAFNWAGQQGWRVALDQASMPGPVPEGVSAAVRADGEAMSCRQLYLERPTT